MIANNFIQNVSMLPDVQPDAFAILQTFFKGIISTTFPQMMDSVKQFSDKLVPTYERYFASINATKNIASGHDNHSMTDVKAIISVANNEVEHMFAEMFKSIFAYAAIARGHEMETAVAFDKLRGPSSFYE